MADIFLSYARETKSRVAAIAHALEAEGYSVWWDAELPVHRSYAEVIDEQIGIAKAVVVAWSKPAKQSQWVRAEADKARNSGKLVQATIDGTLPPLPFDQIHAADLSRWNGGASDDNWQRVSASVASLIRGGAKPARARRRPSPRGGFPVAPAAILALALFAGGGWFLVQNAGAWRGAVTSLVAAPQGAPQQVSATVPAAASSSGATPAPARPELAAGVEYRLEIPSGHAIDLDRGAVTDQVDDDSDFVLSSDDGNTFWIASANPSALVGVDTYGAPTRATCSLEPAIPSISWSIPFADDLGHYQCFKTTEGREGAIIRKRSPAAFNGMAITFQFWN